MGLLTTTRAVRRRGLAHGVLGAVGLLLLAGCNALVGVDFSGMHLAEGGTTTDGPIATKDAMLRDALRASK